MIEARTVVVAVVLAVGVGDWADVRYAVDAIQGRRLEPRKARARIGRRRRQDADTLGVDTACIQTVAWRTNRGLTVHSSAITERGCLSDINRAAITGLQYNRVDAVE